MALIDMASSKSVWRGMEYYKQNKVNSCEPKADGTYEGTVTGNVGDVYHVHLDMEHPKKSNCDCPMANGRKVICKHIVAVSMHVASSEADRFKNEKTIYGSAFLNYVQPVTILLG
ncbi:MAG: SWIM zinc finger domain-containing protein [Lachnospiraceae bacterium]|nr:SWIM zinc finger domain-containing protein [Lachnospiraceae bacterium]